MKRLLSTLISASLLAMPLALVPAAVHAKPGTQAQEGQATTKSKVKSKAKSKKTTAKKPKKPKSAALKPSP